jgi:hypothetical protein
MVGARAGIMIAMRLFLACALLAACTSEPEPAFGLVGVVQNQLQSGSTIGLWQVQQPRIYTYKFGDGEASRIEFGISYPTDPPPAALDARGFGVGLVGQLPGIATTPTGEIDVDNIRLIGLSTDSAVIFKTPGASDPAWLDQFPDGYSCGVCDRDASPNGFVPADCTFVTVVGFFGPPCAW